MSALEQWPEDAALAEAAPDATLAAALGRLAAGDTIVTLLADDVGRRASTLERVLDRMADGDTKIVWIGNPLRSPLTIERVFLQAVGPDADLRVERSPAELAAMMAGSLGDAARMLLILQQPETLDATARDTLAAIAPLLHAEQKPIQILLVGSTAFRLLEQPPPSLAEAVPPTAPVSRRRRELFPVLMLVALVVLGAALVPGFAGRPTRPLVAAPTAQSNADTAALRQEFELFLAQRTPALPALSEPDKDALFKEFLDRHQSARSL